MDFESLYKKMEEEAASPDRYKQKSSFESDPRFYKISKDDKGNGSVVIRLLPSFNKDKTAINTYVVKKVHALQWEKHFPGKDKAEKRWKPEFMCPKTVSNDRSCPVCDFGWDQYNEAKESGEVKEKYDLWRTAFTNSEKILTNILVIKDEKRPENNGKVFLYELSKTVLGLFPKEVEKVKDMTSEDRKACGVPDSMKVFDPYNIMCSRNLTLKFVNKKDPSWSVPADYWGSSNFAISFTGIATSMPEAQEIIEKTYCLDDEIAAKHLISEEEMMSNVDYVLFKDAKPKKEKAPVEEKVPEAPAVSQDMNEMLLKKPTEVVQSAPVVEQPAPVQQPEAPKEEVKVTAPVSEPAKPAQSMSDADFLASLGM